MNVNQPTKKSSPPFILIGLLLILFNMQVFAQGTLSVSGNGNTISNGASSASISNNTDFGNVEIGTNNSNVFVLDNTENGGNPRLRLNNISVSISGSPDFSPVNTNLGDLKGNDNPINHSINFTPSSNGTKTATVTVNFSNGTNAPYTFTIQGTGIEPTPEINVKESNDSSISSGGNFDFGTIAPNSSASETFSIENTGNASTILNLTGNPIVSLSGDSEFSIVSQPSSSSVSGGNSESFIVNYNPLSLGTHNATLNILNDDNNENPYVISLNGTAADITYTPVTSGPDWNVINITPDNELNYPNTIVYGPDNYLWVTERVGKQVVKVDPINGGTKTVMLDLTGVVYQTAGQDGLMGMAIHPDLYSDIDTSNNLVYLAYTYDSGGRKLRIESYRYIAATGVLDSASATTILEGFDASNDHNSGKLQIGPDLKLYYTAGDQGYNQFQNACQEIRAQYLPTSPTDYSDYKGKILRLNLDGSIPSDNPILNSVQSHVYTYGHRNPQGIVFGSNGTLYSSEHGPKVDDELNIITAGKNYGWPEIAGYYDNLGYAYCNWSSSGTCNPADFSDHNCASGVTPISEFTSGQPVDFQAPIGTYNSTSGTEPSGGWLTWPTVGPSSIDIYESHAIPGWNQSLLIPTLKRGTIFRAKLSATGNALESQTYEEFHSSNDRYRDICISPDGTTIYAITDNTGGTSGPSGTTSVSIENPGVIVKIQYTNCIDDDGDGVCNADDICPGFDDTADTDIDGVVDCIDQEISSPCPTDVDVNGVSNDNDSDGIANCLDICDGFDDNLDSDGDSIPDGCDSCNGFDDNIDTDGDGIADGCDPCNDLVDIDGDGVSDCIDSEIPSPCPSDVDSNGISNDNDSDGVADCLDICNGFDDNVDTDGDSIPDGCDSCNGFDDNIDTDGDGIPDGCDSCNDLVDIDGDGVSDCIDLEIPSPCPLDVDANGVSNDDDDDGIPNCLDETCTANTTTFILNPLTHLGSGASTTSILGLSSDSQDVSFTINGIDAVENGKPSNRYIDQVDVSYVDGSGLNQSAGTFLGNTTGSASINISGTVQSVTVTLSDAYDGSTDSTMSINFSTVDFCEFISAGAKTAYGSKQTASTLIESTLKIYPNPASSNLFIDNDGREKANKLFMYNVTGQLINSTILKTGTQKIDISNLSKGLYLIKILDESKNTIKIKRVIIN
ncbi:PQQ-dependent sugar dehydrogenase [Flavisericum labens]|uniref:PQQ-dependent sugar dehydrogenase n=1 Tax=Flavisericum labens TaxID=3377112 RepID=UPI00387B7C10